MNFKGVKDFRGVLFQRSILIIRSDNYVKEYSLQNLKQIVELNTFETYNYNFYPDLTFTSSPNSGHLYVLATQPGNKNLCVLIYRSHAPNIRAFYNSV